MAKNRFLKTWLINAKIYFGKEIYKSNTNSDIERKAYKGNMDDIEGMVNRPFSDGYSLYVLQHKSSGDCDISL